MLDGHGDLLADDVLCLPEGPVVLDCLEFDDRLRHVDGLDDAAFPAMDLERLGGADIAARFLGWHAEFGADPAPAALRHHFVVQRAATAEEAVAAVLEVVRSSRPHGRWTVVEV